jgi:hypothetical protein
MWHAKAIQSAAFACALALLLSLGCASSDRNSPPERGAPQGGSPSQQPADDNNGDNDTSRYARKDHRAAVHRDSDDHNDGQGEHGDDAPRASHKATSDSVVTAPPSLDELPDLKPQRQRSIAGRVDFEGSLQTTRRPVVPSFKELPLTPEEKKVLDDERKKRPDDVMAFYKRQPGIKQGVSPSDGGAQIGIAGRGGVDAGIGRDAPRFGTYGQAGYHAAADGPAKHIAGVDVRVPILARVGPSFVIQIGWGLARRGEAQMPYLEP